MQARAAATLVEIDRRAAFEPEFLTATAFVHHRGVVSGGEARRLVGEARVLADHDRVRQAFESAELDRPRVARRLILGGDGGRGVTA